jgi:MtaA/CmuA family methyltransferase
MLNTFAGEPVDRLAVQPILMTLAARLHGVPYSEYLLDHRVLVEAQLRMIEEFDVDVLTLCSDPCRETQDCGAAVKWFADQPPAHDPTDPFLKEKSQLLTLKQPDPLGGGRMHDRVCGAAYGRERVGNEVPVLGWVEGPMAQAADMRGITEIMYDVVDDPPFVEDLFEFILEMEVNFAKAQLDAGAHIVGIGDAAASLVSPAVYAELVFPYEKRLVDAIHDLGAPVRLHICGNITGHLPKIAELGVEMIDVDFLTDMTGIRQKLGPGPAILGNLDPVRYFLNSPAQDVKTGLAECHRQSVSKFLVGAGCEIPPGAKLDNVRAMAEYAREAV